MRWNLLAFAVVTLSLGGSHAIGGETRTGADLIATIARIQSETLWEGVVSLRPNAPICEFAYFESEGRYYLDIDEVPPGRDWERILSLQFRPDTPFFYSKRGPNEENYFRMTGDGRRFMSVDIVYSSDDGRGAEAMIKLRNGFRSATCIVARGL